MYELFGWDYGLDSVLACWVSSHGGMTSNLFTAAMGAPDRNGQWAARSDLMALGGNYNSFGDERLRYLFLDTCYGIRTDQGNSPRLTWGPRAKGIRMIFGYETESADHPNYGRYFWEEWSKGKSFSQAFFDASARINPSQTPMALAFGATAQEASSRVRNERTLYWDAVKSQYHSYLKGTARSLSNGAGAARAVLLEQDAWPEARQLGVRQVELRGNADRELSQTGRLFGLRLNGAGGIQSRPFGMRAVVGRGATLVVEQNGDFEWLRTRTARQSDGEAPQSDGLIVEDAGLVERAQEIVGQLGFTGAYRVGLIREVEQTDGSEYGEGAPRVVEKTIVIEQLVNGLPFVGPNDGRLEVTFDAPSGEVTRIRSTWRRLRAAESSAESAAGTQSVNSLAEARTEALSRAAQSFAQHNESAALEIVPESEAIGWQVQNGKSVPAYRVLLRAAGGQFTRPFEVVVPLLRTTSAQ